MAPGLLPHHQICLLRSRREEHKRTKGGFCSCECTHKVIYPKYYKHWKGAAQNSHLGRWTMDCLVLELLVHQVTLKFTINLEFIFTPKIWILKGQLILKCLFGVFNSPKNKRKQFAWGTIVVKLNFFVCFLVELKIPKRHFEINWSLLTNAMQELVAYHQIGPKGLKWMNIAELSGLLWRSLFTGAPRTSINLSRLGTYVIRNSTWYACKYMSLLSRYNFS